MEIYFWIIITRTNYLVCENFVIFHTATDLSFDDVWLFRFQAFEHWNKKIQSKNKISLHLNSKSKYLGIVLTKFGRTKNTIWFWQFALLSKTIIFKWRLIYNWHFLWMYAERLCLFIVEEEGTIFHFCLACSDFYTKNFIHSISIDNMIHPINCEHAWTWNLKFSKNFSVPSQAQVLGSTWPVDH